MLKLKYYETENVVQDMYDVLEKALNVVTSTLGRRKEKASTDDELSRAIKNLIGRRINLKKKAGRRV